MEKKLTAQGPKKRKSYTITLPIDFVKAQGLDKTRTVELDIVGNKAIISASKKPGQAVFIDGKDYENSILKVLQGLYRCGVSEVRLRYANPKQLEEATRVIEQHLIGYEVMEQKSEYVTIKDITKESEEDFVAIFRRIFLLILELTETSENVKAESLHKNIKKLINYCQRMLVMKGHAEFRKTPLYYLILDRLEKLSEEMVWLNLVTGKELGSEAKAAFRNIYELFYKFEAKRFNQESWNAYNARHELRKEVTAERMHTHNIMRLLNSLTGDIFVLRFKE